MGKAKLLIIVSVVLVFCFVPVLDMEYLVVVEKQVLEPYTVLEEVQEPYQDWYDEVIWPDNAPVGEYYPTVKQRPITRYRIVIKEVTKTRLVTRPVVETRTKRVSILRYLLR